MLAHVLSCSKLAIQLLTPRCPNFLCRDSQAYVPLTRSFLRTPSKRTASYPFPRPLLKVPEAFSRSIVAQSRKSGWRPPNQRAQRTRWVPPTTVVDIEERLPADVAPADGQAVGLVVAAQANFMRVLVEKAGGEVRGAQGAELLCTVRAVLKKMKKRVLVGDRVVVGGIDWADGRGVVDEVLKRESALEDPPVANCNHFLVQFALVRPDLEPKQLSRFLVAAESAGLSFSVALNKADLAPPGVAEEWQGRLREWGYSPVLLSMVSGQGLQEVAKALAGKVSVVAGPSGAGKTSLINALQNVKFPQESPSEIETEDFSSNNGIHSTDKYQNFENIDNQNNGHYLCEASANIEENTGLKKQTENEEEKRNSFGGSFGGALDPPGGFFQEQAVGDVQMKSGLGKHTTRNIILLRIPGGGLLADTPGFSLPSLGLISSSELPDCFPEIRQRLASASEEGRTCAFKDCRHMLEPSCVVGSDWERHTDYVQLLEEVCAREEKEKTTYGTKKESAVRYRKTKASGVRQAEPKLVTQKHRRQSRKKAQQTLQDFLAEEEDDDGDLEVDELGELEDAESHSEADADLSSLHEVIRVEVRDEEGRREQEGVSKQAEVERVVSSTSS